MIMLMTLIITPIFSILSAAFVRFQFHPVKELFPNRHDFKSAVLKILIGAFFILSAIILYDSLINLHAPALTFFSKPLSPVTLRTILIGSLLGTLMLCAFRLIILKHKKKPYRVSQSAALTRIGIKALLIPLVLEICLFNFRHHQQIFQKAEGQTFDPSQFTTEGFFFDAGAWQYQNDPDYTGARKISISFEPTEIYDIRFGFASNEISGTYRIEFDDSAYPNNIRSFPVQLTPGLPRSFIIPTHTVGKTQRITLVFPYLTAGMTYYFRLHEIELNPKIAYRFEIERYLFCVLFFYVILLLFPGNGISDQVFDPKNRFQKICSISIYIIIFTWFIWIIAESFIGYSWTGDLKADFQRFTKEKAQKNERYNAYYEQTDAFLAGQLHLLDEPDESLLNAEYPYDPTYRSKFNVKVKWDRAYYKGRYYCYFGPVPVILSFLPFKFLTKVDMPSEFAHVVFMLFAIWGFQKIFNFIIQNYFPTTSFGIYHLTFVGVLTSTQIPFLARTPFMYQIAIHGSISFSICAVALTLEGIHNLIKSTTISIYKTRHIIVPLFFAGFFAGLAVGCRATSMYTIIWHAAIALHLTIMQKTLSFQRLAAAFSAFAIPLGVIALLLMAYNDFRFDSPTQFGFRYQLSAPNESVGKLRTSPTGILYNIFIFLFQPFGVSLEFPNIKPIASLAPSYLGYIPGGNVIGLFTFPWFWGIIALHRNWKTDKRIELKPVIIGSFLSAIAILVTTSIFATSFRYSLDFAWILTVPTFISWLIWINSNGKPNCHSREFILYDVTIITVIIALFFSITGDDNYYQVFDPLGFQKLRFLFNFWL